MFRDVDIISAPFLDLNGYTTYTRLKHIIISKVLTFDNVHCIIVNCFAIWRKCAFVFTYLLLIFSSTHRH